MRIYISGPMTGRPDHNLAAFENAVCRLREQGHFVISPAEISALFGTPDEIAESFEALYRIEDETPPPESWQAMGWCEHFKNMDRRMSYLARSIMSADLAAVRSCDAIYLLRGWETSRGAKKELAEAIAHGLQITQELEGAGA